MAGSSLLEVEALLKPISAENPAGVDLRLNISAESAYQRLREVRIQARNRERSALAEGVASYVNVSDWAPILDVAPTLLTSSAKDIEVTSWLIEALVRRDGFKGVAVGFNLANQLIERYGETLYPLPDEEGVATQLAPLIGLNGFGGDGALIPPLKAIPITQGASCGPFAVWQCEQAMEVSRISDPNKRQARYKQGAVSKDDIDRAVVETPTPFFQTLQTDIRAALAVYEAFRATVDKYCQSDPQPTGKIYETLNASHQTLIYLAGSRLVIADDGEGDMNASNGTAGGHVGLNSGLIQDREAALKSLRSAANFFRRTEPHSPISYAIEQAVYWSELSLPDLMRELLPDESARNKYQTLTGIRERKVEK
ncbi:MAG: type VI secretion system protein TssA [Gammaproteobacteria bacterium]|nr:type VI secretion system protein TssA [Gammaproteobacteria bacterium]